jgi:hypothetical protein
LVAGPYGHRTPIRFGNIRPRGAGFFVLRAEIDHRGDLIDELDLEVFSADQHDAALRFAGAIESRNFTAVSVAHLPAWPDPFQELPDWYRRNSSDETAEIAGHNRVESSTPEQADDKARQ